jgi:amicoumacin kinase
VRWLAEIPHFMKLREIDLYSVIMRDAGPEHIDDYPWTAESMRGRRQWIENGAPCLDVSLTEDT